MSIITEFQIKNNPSKVTDYLVTSIGASVIVSSPLNGTANLKISSLTISRSDSNYSVFTCPVDPDSLLDLQTLLADADAILTLTILYFTQQGTIYTAINVVLDLDDFRIDTGVKSTTVSLISRSAYNIPKSVNTVIGSYVEKRKLSSPSTNYQYRLNPVDFLKYSLNTVVTDGAISLKIISNHLSLSSDKESFFFAVGEPV